MHDVVIVGARCAGSPLAMLLARAGHDVLMVDRATFPSDTMSTHFIQSPGMARLARWGLMEDVLATNCPSVTGVRFSINGDIQEIDVPLDERLPGLAAPRRTVLDKLLVDAAVAAGAELADGISIDSLIYDGDRVAGVRGHSSEGAFEASARIVVGADGRNSVVAREVEPEYLQDHGHTSAGYYSYYAGLELERFEAYLHDDAFAVVVPTNDDLTVVGVAWRNDEFREKKRDIEGNFLASLDSLGDIGERVRAAERVERFVGAVDFPNYLKKSYGPGWALVGDACCHKDPIPADGISDALRGAEYLSESIAAVLGGEDEETALSRYESRNRAVIEPLLDAAVKTGTFDLTPQQRFEAFIGIRMRDAEEMNEVLAAA